MFPKIFKKMFVSLMVLSYANLIMSCSYSQKMCRFRWSSKPEKKLTNMKNKKRTTL